MGGGGQAEELVKNLHVLMFKMGLNLNLSTISSNTSVSLQNCNCFSNEAMEASLNLDSM